MKNRYLAPLYQLQTLLLQFDDATYAMPLQVLNQSSVGQHTRHILEFYQCLCTGLEAGIIDYDARKREGRIEQEVAYTQGLINQMIDALAQTASNKSMRLVVEGDYLETSLMRELHYLTEHTIHHLAIIRIGLQECLKGITFDESLGVAPATLTYRANHA